MEKEIYKIIDKEKLHVVSESIEKAHGLPNECYLNGPYANIERKKIFEDKWVTIGVASSLPNPGDTKPFDLLGIPLIIVRDKKNKIRVFHNVCSHRGYKLIQESCSLKTGMLLSITSNERRIILLEAISALVNGERSFF